MTLTDVQTLFDYHYWARDRALAAAALLTPDEFSRPLGSSFASVQETLIHIYSAEWAWHSRWVGVSPRAHLPIERFPDVATLRAAWTATEAQVRGYLSGLDDAALMQEISYQSLAGIPGRSVLLHMMQQVINHATYHRGQVSTMLRQLGAAPTQSQDLITFYRERAV